jgi:protein Mpv17
MLQKHINLSTTNRTIAARVAADQFVFAPTNMALFLSSMAYLEGSSPKEKLKKAYVTGLTYNFMVWPWVQGVNFKFVPLEHRVLVVNVVSLGE